MLGQDTPTRKAILPGLQSELVGVRFRPTGATVATSLEEQKEKKKRKQEKKRRMKN